MPAMFHASAFLTYEALTFLNNAILEAEHEAQMGFYNHFTDDL